MEIPMVLDYFISPRKPKSEPKQLEKPRGAAASHVLRAFQGPARFPARPSAATLPKRYHNPLKYLALSRRPALLLPGAQPTSGHAGLPIRLPALAVLCGSPSPRCLGALRSATLPPSDRSEYPASLRACADVRYGWPMIDDRE
jgi:hypothetical protein